MDIRTSYHGATIVRMAEETLQSLVANLVDNGRMKATCKAVVSNKAFQDVLRAESKDASAVFLGFQDLS